TSTLRSLKALIGDENSLQHLFVRPRVSLSCTAALAVAGGCLPSFPEITCRHNDFEASHGAPYLAKSIVDFKRECSDLRFARRAHLSRTDDRSAARRRPWTSVAIEQRLIDVLVAIEVVFIDPP